MREKKKPLKFKKYIVANLRTHTLKGGTSNPCVPTGPSPSETCQTFDGYSCPLPDCNPDTRTLEMTQPDNPCTCGGAEGGNSVNGCIASGPGCP